MGTIPKSNLKMTETVANCIGGVMVSVLVGSSSPGPVKLKQSLLKWYLLLLC